VNNIEILEPTKVIKIKSSEVEKIIEGKYGDFLRIDLQRTYCIINYTPKF
jgi:hypothetical protein